MADDMPEVWVQIELGDQIESSDEEASDKEEEVLTRMSWILCRSRAGRPPRRRSFDAPCHAGAAAKTEYILRL